ncbi:hypothetical protein SAMN06297129_3983 [Pseudooceanicola antarcticus]|uniref:Uncharacterized protein n=1 Tax=Pseudooceanicola antarcticus TaxID=1247613 RepID=A0A285JKP0_9RHOB|nr:hypothetical protein [Pseudooceanicola antarcticus]PJE26502.1 hypothetical protein CVM39_17485 [Pseudooceanicola antarcticus]SNY60834.1 hypothetical protein SAMN06297129_3983 [Pseudooceanicola antarcticus]
MIDHLSERHQATQRARRPLGEVLFAGLFWIAAAAATCAFALYLTSDTARQHVAPEVFLGARP